MTQKVNGAAYPGVWVEKQVTFVKLTFSGDISAIPAANLVELGTTTPVTAGTVADSTFAVVESAMVQALKTLELSATVLGVSKYNTSTYSVDVMLGFAEGWFSDVNGVIATGLPVGSGSTPAPNVPPQFYGVNAVITTAGAGSPAYPDTVGTLVSVLQGAYTFSMEFVYMDGSMPVATAANGGLELGVGATSGATPTNSPTGTPGYYPVELAAS